jgi:hypothetical protein
MLISPLLDTISSAKVGGQLGERARRRRRPCFDVPRRVNHSVVEVETMNASCHISRVTKDMQRVLAQRAREAAEIVPT